MLHEACFSLGGQMIIHSLDEAKEQIFVTQGLRIVVQGLDNSRE